MIEKIKRKYTLTEEVWHSLTHGVGVALSIAGLTVLVTLTAIYSDAWRIVGASIFGVSMMMMYSASTIYHAIPYERAKVILKKFDHIAIYYLIAGTYTPFMLGPMRDAWGWTLFGIVWGLALLGTVLKLFLNPAGTKFWSIGLYLGMGWLIVFASKRLFSELPASALVFLVLGGLFYTLGIAFYVWKSKAYTHVIWHAFVLLGTIMHFFAILFSCVFLPA